MFLLDVSGWIWLKLYLLESLESGYEPCRLQPVWKPIFNYMNADVDKIIYMWIPISISTKMNNAFSYCWITAKHWFSKYGFVATLYFGILLYLGTVFVLFLQVDAFWSLLGWWKFPPPSQTWKSRSSSLSPSKKVQNVDQECWLFGLTPSKSGLT